MDKRIQGLDSGSSNKVVINTGTKESFEIFGFFLESASKEDTLLKIAQELYLRGIVCAEYGSMVLEREMKYPTGLPTTPVSVAIPHSDKIYAFHSAVAIVRLNKPIVFQNMGAPEEELFVELIFLLAIPQDEDQVLMIQTIMEVVQNQETLIRLMHAETEQELAIILQDYCMQQPKKDDMGKEELLKYQV